MTVTMSNLQPAPIPAKRSGKSPGNGQLASGHDYTLSRLGRGKLLLGCSDKRITSTLHQDRRLQPNRRPFQLNHLFYNPFARFAITPVPEQSQS
ncbi:unnamed protein product [Protopolystoma xenopodis]|uniref:Uncharacterized protein n=1 Tax=Protopolystoma xenopodis TaxID=117903 RepID=A0A3S5CI10_9PLAT|nr:unnamed protein product [Protopolystoma xenopodis]